MLIQLAGDAVGRPQLADGLQYREPDRRRAAGRARASPTSRSPMRDDYTTLAWLAGTAALDRMNRPAERDRDVRPLRAGRQVAAGPDQGQLLGRPGGAGGRQAPAGERLFQPGRGLSGTVLRPACARAARPLGPAAARRAAAICDDAGAAHRLQQPPPGPGGPAARPAGPFDRAGVVREGARRIARQ